MKRTFALIMVLAMLALAVPGVADGLYLSEVNNATNVRYIGAEIVGGVAYTWESYSATLYAISNGGQTVETHTFDPEAAIRPLALFSCEGALYAVASDASMRAGVYKLLPSENGALSAEQIGALDFEGLTSQMGEIVQMPSVHSATMADGKLFAVLSVSGETRTWSFSLDTGARGGFTMDVETFLASNGSLVMLISKIGGVPTLCTFDASNGTEQKICELPTSARAFAYDGNAAKLYYFSDGLYRVDSPLEPQGTLVGNIPLMGATFLVSDGTSLLATLNEEAYFSTLGDGGVSIRTLSLYGGSPYDLISGFTAENPDVSIQILDIKTDSEVLADALAHNPLPDVYGLQSANNPYFVSLRDRGYLAEITDPTAKALVDSSREGIRQECYDDNGILRAIPVTAIIQGGLAVDRELWNSLELGALPQTWDELFDFLDRWCETGNEHAEIPLLGYPSAQETRAMFGYALRRDYDAYRATHPDHPSYDTELYRRLLHRLVDVDFENLRYDQTGISLISDLYLPSPEYSLFADTSRDMLHLSVDGTTPSPGLANVGFVGVNPSTPNMDLAMEFVAYCAGNLSDVSRAMFCPDFNTVVYSDQYEQTMAEYEQSAQSIQSQMESTDDPAQQEALRLQLEALAQQKNNYLQGNAYKISEQTLAKYQDDVRDGLLVTFGEGIMDSGVEQNLSDIQQRFIEGMMSVEEYTRSLDQILLMQELEQQ